MAKTQLEINADLTKMKKLAQTLRETAASVRSTANNDYQQAVNTLHTSWEGENAAAFMKKAEAIRKDLEGTASQLEASAQTLEDIAAKYAQAELEALKAVEKK